MLLIAGRSLAAAVVGAALAATNLTLLVGQCACFTGQGKQPLGSLQGAPLYRGHRPAGSVLAATKCNFNCAYLCVGPLRAACPPPAGPLYAAQWQRVWRATSPWSWWPAGPTHPWQWQHARPPRGHTRPHCCCWTGGQQRSGQAEGGSLVTACLAAPCRGHNGTSLTGHGVGCVCNTCWLLKLCASHSC